MPWARRRACITALQALLLSLAAMPVARPQDAPPTAWQVEKCQRYKTAWADVVARRGLKGLSPDFVARHDAFIASGCLARGDVCPRSPEEFEVANILVVLGMNAGMASTFFPFACR